MLITRRQFVATSAGGLLLPGLLQAAPDALINRELTGKTICGYQGWFNAEGDGRDLGYRHYQTHEGLFRPGHCTIDLWPDVSECDPEERYNTAFVHRDGQAAEVFSSAHTKTISRHFEWMWTYGIDGIAIQRFGSSLRNDKIRAHHDEVIAQAREAATRTGRLWMTMYDLSGMRRGEPQVRIVEDWRDLVERRGVMQDPTYLHHRGKPVVAVWGVGFNDQRDYTLGDCAELIEHLRRDDRVSLMLGIPYHWREQGRDATDDPGLHDLLRQADILSPWAVGRFSTLKQAEQRQASVIEPDLAWCLNEGKHYLPVAFPGFSWHNLNKSRGRPGKLDQIPRQGGRLLWAQAEAVRRGGAESLYIAMFDEVDEATAIFKCTNDPPVGDSPFLTYEGLPSDHYLWLTGKITERLREGGAPPVAPMPERA